MESENGVQPHQIYNILLLGMLGVGKSALTVKYITKRFINEYHPFLEGTYSKLDVIDGDELLLRIYDSGSPDDTPENVSQQYSQKLEWADAIVVVYSINNMPSFQYARDLLNQLSKANLSNKIFLVCNKIDMERYRQVGRDESEQLAFEHDVFLYETCSCSDYELVRSMFHDVVRQVRKGGLHNARSPVTKKHATSSLGTARINHDEFSRPRLTIRDEQSDFFNNVPSSLPSSYTNIRKGSESSPILNDVSDVMLFRNYNNNSEAIGTRYGSCIGIHKKALSLSDDALDFSALRILDSPSEVNAGRRLQHGLTSSTKSTTSLKEKFSGSGHSKARRHTGFSLFNNKFKIF